MEHSGRGKLAVIGTGNPLYGDDGFGTAAIDRLRGEPLPEDVNLIDAGTMGVGLLEYFKDYRRVIMIDAADMGLAPGTVRVFRPDEVRSLRNQGALSLHSTDILGVIELGRTLGEKLADIHIVACQPEFLGIREGLSQTALEALPVALAHVRRIIEKG